MNVTANVNGELFHNAPPLRIERALGLIKPGRPHVVRRALLAALIAWAPLALIAILELLIFKNEKSFFPDFSVHARFLVTLPALILAEAECVLAGPLTIFLKKLRETKRIGTFKYGAWREP